EKDQQAAYAATIFGKEAMSGMLAIINTSEEDYNKLSDAIYNSAGAAKQMSDVMQDNLEGSMIQLKSAIEGAMISIYELAEGPIRNLIDMATEWVQKFIELDDSTKNIILIVGGLAAALGPVLIVLGMIVSAIG